MPSFLRKKNQNCFVSNCKISQELSSSKQKKLTAQSVLEGSLQKSKSSKNYLNFKDFSSPLAALSSSRSLKQSQSIANELAALSTQKKLVLKQEP